MTPQRNAAPPVLAATRGNVRILTFNRPDRSNCFSPDLVDGLEAELRRCERDEAVNVVVLTGSGRTFCAGLDLKHLASLRAADRRAYLSKVLELFRLVWRLPQPVVAAVNGAAVAGGFDLSVFCDVRLASEEAIFAQTEVLIGVNPIPTLLHRIVGLGHAKELGMTASRISAAEAHRIGLVNHVYPANAFVERSLGFATTLASRPRGAVVETKRITRDMLDQTVEEGLLDAGESILKAMDTPAFQRQLGAYLEQLTAKSAAPDA
ncbi:MAG TPA: enoyl-CoA hydratase/isomerase family protein [Candidatus Thermoplasmatota archaeon]|nr:enoyl-CoA hydratase/isomerase family protein [Candidatus Thermoplasmatota archaeon]